MPEPTRPEPSTGPGPEPGTTAGPARPRRRQARGERRIAQLLDAAAQVFSSSGFTAASTNAIARAAGVSPGTLYQYFPNKEAIAIELGGRLLEKWRESQGSAAVAAGRDLPLDELLDAVIDPLFAFNYENPAFAVLIHGPDTPGQIAEEFTSIHDGLLTRIEQVLAHYLPQAPPDELSRVVNTTFAVFRSGLDLALAHEGEEREAYAAEVKRVLFRYLEPLFPEGDDCVPLEDTQGTQDTQDRQDAHDTQDAADTGVSGAAGAPRTPENPLRKSSSGPSIPLDTP
ncbi:TetR family transcriptional regulator [Streptomyces sp. NPDC055078]